MAFEFDPRKSAANLAKHGIDFVEAQRLWEDPDLLEIPARTEDEPRWLIIGRIDAKLWSAVVTSRRDAIRLISVRRSRDDEVALYEGKEI
ncbi:MAG: BrnT family toxin [Gammaproteobacteria bacterium]|nr:MAG: BrnT family toxin [Gammaproteobacteria bacterium]